jgi:hypothetical protein
MWFPVKRGDPRPAEDLFRLLPAPEPRERVGSHQQPELFSRPEPAERAKRVDGVGGGLSVELFEGNTPVRPSLETEGEHCDAVSRIRRLRFFVRREAGRNVENALQAELQGRGFDCPQVSVVDGIEGASEDADAHGGESKV